MTRLATYDTPWAIARDLKERFGVEIAPQSVERYHPERASGGGLAQRWKELFWETRSAYIVNTAEIGATHKPLRICVREDMVHEARYSGQLSLANEILNDIAKKVGDAFENKHKRGRMGLGDVPFAAKILINGRPCLEPEPEAGGGDPAPRG